MNRPQLLQGTLAVLSLRILELGPKARVHDHPCRPEATRLEALRSE
jgi:hypothetical protein